MVVGNVRDTGWLPDSAFDAGAGTWRLLTQAFSATYPGHPRFEPEDRDVRPAELAAVLDAVERAHQDRDGRVFVEDARRDAVRRVANVLSSFGS